MSEINFSSFQLIINNNKSTEQDLLQIFNESADKETIENTFYSIEKENIENKYYWFYAIYGSPKPYGEKVANILSDKISNNSRPHEEAELKNQLFVIYNAISDVLYISNLKKKSMFENYLKRKLKKDVIIKYYYKTAEEFLKMIKTIDSIELVSKKNLFSEKSGLFEDSKNIFGLGNPEQLKLNISFGYSKITDSFKTYIAKFINKRSSAEIESLVCVGKDDKDMISVFNIDTFIKKIDIQAQKNDRGLYDSIQIKKDVITRLKENTNV